MVSVSVNQSRQPLFSLISGNCDCCGLHSVLSENYRPEVEPLTDEKLLQMVDDQGEESTQIYYERSLRDRQTYECKDCRSLLNEHYFICLSLKEDR